MNIFQFLLPPILGGIIALSTNWIAIKMLFRPHKEMRIFGLRLPFTPGLIPRERGRLGRKLGEAISKHLLTPDILASKLADPATWPLPDCTIGELLESWGQSDPAAYIAQVISTPAKKAIDIFLPKAIEGLFHFPEKFPILDTKLAELTTQVAQKSTNPIAGLFVKHEKIYLNIKEAVFEYLSEPDNRDAMLEAIHNAIDGVMWDEKPLDDDAHETQQRIADRICAFHISEGVQLLFTQDPYASIIRRILEVAANYLATHMPVSDMIEKKMSELDIAETESILLSVVGRELKMIIWLGGLFGFLIGLLSLLL
ncbi:MAG: DUF445 family protein [Defluviitaleaceae bacterium]|nr:DUF445 family protein [Defluviitaleaceae bacterium]